MKAIKARTVLKTQWVGGKSRTISEIRTVLWDSPVLREAYRKASEAERKQRKK